MPIPNQPTVPPEGIPNLVGAPVQTTSPVNLGIGALNIGTPNQVDWPTINYGTFGTDGEVETRTTTSDNTPFYLRDEDGGGMYQNPNTVESYAPFTGADGRTYYNVYAPTFSSGKQWNETPITGTLTEDEYRTLKGGSSAVGNMLKSPVGQFALNVTGLAPFVNTFNAVKSGNILGAVGGAAGIGGYSDVANAANIANSIKNKDAFGLAMAGTNAAGIQNIGGVDTQDIARFVNTTKALQSGSPTALMGVGTDYSQGTAQTPTDDLQTAASSLANMPDTSSITAPTDIASLQGILSDSSGQIISDAPFTGAPTNVASASGRSVMNSGPASTRTLDSGAGLNPNTLANWGGSKVNPNFINAASPYLGWDPSTYFPKVDVRMAAPTAAYGNVPEYDYNPDQQTYLNIAPYLTSVANKYNEPGMAADVLTHELAHVGQKLSSKPGEDPTKLYLRMAHQAGLSTTDVFNRPSDITNFNNALNDAIPYISKTYGTNAGTYLGNPKAPLFEKLTDLAAIEMQTGKDLTKDPVLKETLFKDPRVQAMYNTLTIPRMTRLDPRDLPTGTVTTSDFPKGEVPLGMRFRNMMPARSKGWITPYAKGGMAEVEKGMDFSGSQDTMTTNSPQGTDMAASPAANPFADPNTMAVYDQMRQSVSPKEFGDQLLDGAAQTNPQEVAAFRSALEQIEMPPEALDLLNNMVDEILANPEQYDQIRAKYKEMGAPDEILPEQFDPQFFSALNMAVDQMIGEPAGVQAFAKGGIAELSPVAKAIASYGRNGDTMLAHITPAEARMLRRKGGSGTINPVTGLPEFFLDLIGKAFKSIGNAVKKFASSTVGRIVTTVALGFFLGPAAASFMGVTSAAGVAAVSGFVGSAGATLAGGGNLSQALKAGAVGGITAGAVSGVTGGFSTDYTGPTTVGGQVDKFTGMFNSPAFPQYTAQGALTDNATSNAAREAYAGELYKTNPEAFYNPVAEQTPAPDSFTPKKVTLGGGPVTQSLTPGGATVTHSALGFDYAENNPLLTPEQRVAGMNAEPTRTFGAAPSASQMAATSGNTIAPPIQSAPLIQASPYATPGIGDSLSTAGKGIMQMMPGTEGTFSQGLENFTKGAGDLLSPGPSSAEVTARAKDILTADTTGKMTYADALKAANAEGPGFLRSYGPATAAGIAAIGAFGGFTPKSAPISPYQSLLTGGPGSARDLMSKDPSRYYIQGLPGVQYYNGSVIKPPGMATGGEVQHFVKGGPALASDEQVAEWWAANSDKGLTDSQIAATMDQFGVTPEQFSRSIGANEATAADIANRYAALENTGGTSTGTTTVTGGGGNDVVTNVTGGGGGGNGGITDLVTDVGTTNVTGGGGGGGGITDLGTGGGNTRSASDEAIWKFFSNNTGLTDAQIVAAMNANKWTTADIARVTGTTDRVDEYNRRFAAANAANTTTTTTTNTSTGTGTGTNTRSAADQAIFDYFLTPGLTDAQIVGAMKTNNWTLEDIARVTGTTNRLDEYRRRFTAVNTTGTGTGTGTGTSVSTNTSIIRTTGTSTSVSTNTGTAVGTGTGSITAPWFINPQSFAYDNRNGVVVPSTTLRGKELPTDAFSRMVQGDLQAAGPSVSDATMQQWMDKQGWDPRQVAYALNTGYPEVQGRYWNAKNTGILGATAPATTIKQPYNNTEGITQLMSPTGPLGEFSTRKVAPVAPILPVTPTAATLPNVSFNRTDVQQRLPNIPNGNAMTPLNVLAGQPSQYGVTGYTDAFSPFANQAPGAKLMNMGGIAGLAQGGYPRRNGQIEGPGTATSDSIPAMLSDGEFVMTAKAVRGAGKGDRRAGAKRMYALMHQLEQNAARG